MENETTTVPELTEAELDEVQGGQGTQACAMSPDGGCVC
jgi:hypothetical protein